MSSPDVDLSEEAAIIRALLVARGPSGATLEQVKGKWL